MLCSRFGVRYGWSTRVSGLRKVPGHSHARCWCASIGQISTAYYVGGIDAAARMCEKMLDFTDTSESVFSRLQSWQSGLWCGDGWRNGGNAEECFVGFRTRWIIVIFVFYPMTLTNYGLLYCSIYHVVNLLFVTAIVHLSVCLPAAQFKNERFQSVQTWYREWPWDILEVIWFGVERSRSQGQQQYTIALHFKLQPRFIHIRIATTALCLLGGDTG